MVQSRPRYIVGWMPRVNGGSPGSPGSVPFGSKIGGSGAPYVVSNFARSGTRLVASAYFVRSHSARSWLFLGTRRWYPRLCAPRRLTERLQHPEIDELAGDLFCRKIDAERFVYQPGRELNLDQAD